MVPALEGLAGLALSEGDNGNAARWFAAADAERKRIRRSVEPSRRPERERSIAAVRQALGDAAFATAWAEGQAMRMNEALRLAMG
jgi:hypothetical protein